MSLKYLFSRRISATVLAGVAAVIALLLFCGVGHSRATPPASASLGLPQVTVAEVIHRPLREWQEFSGRLQAVNTV
jgi:hypothetical protein